MSGTCFAFGLNVGEFGREDCSSRSMKIRDSTARRLKMVKYQIAARGVRDQRVLDAMRTVPREEFLSPELGKFAYEDTPLPISSNQTISQPYIVAFMIESLLLEGGETVLEIGTGSGYATAVLANVAGEVYTVERIRQLADSATEKLCEMGFTNVHVLHGDGTCGWPEHAPFDAIIVTAGGPRVPDSLRSQLKVGGRMVIPVGSTVENQKLVGVTRLSDTEFSSENIADVRFVPLIGKSGWDIKKERE